MGLSFKTLRSFSFSTAIQILICSVASIVFLLLFPFLIIAYIPFFLWRYSVTKSARFLNPSLGKIVSARGSIVVAADHNSLYKNPKCNVISSCTFQGNLDFNVYQETFRKQVIEAKLPNGELLYPELQQYLTKWAGYYFWKTDKEFNFNDHFKLYEKVQGEIDRVTDEDLQDLRQELIESTWEEKKPVWKMLVIRNYYPSGTDDPGPHSVMMGLFHHSLGDGYAWLTLLTQRLFDSKEKFLNVIPHKPKLRILETLMFRVTVPFKMAYTAALAILILPLMNFPWKVPLDAATKAWTVNGLTDRIPVSRIKEIKDHFQVSFSSVIFAVYAGVQRDMLIKKNYRVADVPCINLLPLPRPTIKFRNYFTYGLTTLPVSEPDPIRRLEICFKEYNMLKTSVTPLLMKYVIMVMGSFPNCIAKGLAVNKGLSAGISIFPGGKTQLSFKEHKVVETMFTVGIQQGCAGIVCSAMTHGDIMRISPAASSEMLTNDDMKEMSSLFQKHIDILYQYVVV